MSLATVKDSAQSNEKDRDKSPSRISQTAMTLLANMTIGNSYSNTDPVVKLIKISVPALVSLFTNQLKPLIYANARQLSLETTTNLGDINELNSIVYTMAISAVRATRTVAFHKAERLLTNVVGTFGPRPEHDKFSFPAVTTLIINSIGPVIADRTPYRCEFIPYIIQQEVTALYTDARYNIRRGRIAHQALKSLSYWVNFVDVDVNEQTSSGWWTMHIVPSKRRDLEVTCIHAYNPMSFNDLDSATTLAAVTLEKTLYTFPGPCHTTKIGPFIAPKGSSTFNDIPLRFRSDLSVNQSPPVCICKFTTIQEATPAMLIMEYQHESTHGRDNRELLNEIPYHFLRAEDSADEINKTVTSAVQAYLQEIEQGYAKETTTEQPQEESAKKMTRTTPRFKHPDIESVDGINEIVKDTNYNQYVVDIYYFDHQFLKDFRVENRNQIVLKANH
jgi:hypothetical protein